MARSTYIYLVMDGVRPAAAFTVKHELKSWLTRNYGDFTIYRIGDGGYGKSPTVMEAP